MEDLKEKTTLYLATRLNEIMKEQRQELRNWLEKQVFNRGGSSIDLAIEIHTFCKVLDKLNELEGGKNE